MNIVVCCKLTPDASDIEVRSDGAISLERAEWGIGSFDLQALEAGVRLVEAGGGKVTALSAGPQKINQSKLKKDLLSRGPDELAMVADDRLAEADTAVTAQALAQAVRKLGEVDLVLCGEGSADLYFQQVGIQLGERLGWPVLNAIGKIEVLEGGRLRVERHLEDEIEVLELPLPAVLAVTTDINPPRLPTMKEILKAARKPVAEWALEEIGAAETEPRVAVVSTSAPRQVQRKNVQISGTPEEAAQKLLDAMKQEGLV